LSAAHVEQVAHHPQTGNGVNHPDHDDQASEHHGSIDDLKLQ
jgi:hypothetical protein